MYSFLNGTPKVFITGLEETQENQKVENHEKYLST